MAKKQQATMIESRDQGTWRSSGSAKLARFVAGAEKDASDDIDRRRQELIEDSYRARHFDAAEKTIALLRIEYSRDLMSHSAKDQNELLRSVRRHTACCARTRMNNTTSVSVLGRVAERLLDVLDRWRVQRSRDDKEVPSLMRFAEDRDLMPLGAVDAPTSNHASFQRGVFGQPGIAAFGQETVVMLGKHFDQNLHGRKLRTVAAQVKGARFDDCVTF
jgi:hypothetical protein